MLVILFVFFFFFQAEDGIRDLYVTGVQTCALPILPFKRKVTVTLLSRSKFVAKLHATQGKDDARQAQKLLATLSSLGLIRSEERRVGKECRSRWSPEQ